MISNVLNLLGTIIDYFIHSLIQLIMKIIILSASILFLGLSSSKAVSQIVTSKTQTGFSAQARQYNTLQIQRIIASANEFPDLKEIKGSPYYTENFVMSNISLDNKILDRELTRYNAYADEMEIPGPGEETLAILKFEGQTISTPEVKFTCRKKTGNNLGYYILHGLVDDVEILESIEIVYDQGRKAQTSLEREVPASFKERNKYFLFDTKTNKMTEIKLSSKRKLSNELQKIRPEWKESLTTYNNKIKTPSDLLQALNGR